MTFETFIFKRRFSCSLNCYFSFFTNQIKCPVVFICYLWFTKPIIWFKLILISWYDASHWVRKQIASSIVPESSQHTLLSRSIYIYVIVVYNVYMPALPFPAFSTFIHLSLSASFPTEAAQSDNSPLTICCLTLG